MNRPLVLRAMLIALAMSMLAGCFTTTMQTRAKLTRSVVLDHSLQPNRLIYLQVTNTSGSGGEDMDLYGAIKEKLEQKDYRVVTTSKGASYGLFVNILFANNLKEANAIRAGASTGTLAGVSAFRMGNSGTDSLLIGAGVALAGGIIGKLSEDEVFRAVIDISIRDYQDAPVRTVKASSMGDAQLHNTSRTGALNSLSSSFRNSDGATDMASNILEASRTETVKNYEEFKTRAFVEAIRMNLELADALPVLQEKASRQIANLF